LKIFNQSSLREGVSWEQARKEEQRYLGAATDWVERRKPVFSQFAFVERVRDGVIRGIGWKQETENGTANVGPTVHTGFH